MKYFNIWIYAISFILIFGLQKCSAQKKSFLNPVKGYRETLTAEKNLSDFKTSRVADNLLRIVLQSNESNLIIPLLAINPLGDTVILFFKSNVLKNKTEVSFLNGENFRKLALWEINKKDVIERKQSFYDSTFRYMQNNMMVNTVIFDFDKFSSSNIDGYCCRPNGYIDRLKEIYLFFINGILVKEDESTGKLFYLPY